MSKYVATYGLGASLSDMGDQKSGIQAAHRIFQVNFIMAAGNDDLMITGVCVGCGGRQELSDRWSLYLGREAPHSLCG